MSKDKSKSGDEREYVIPLRIAYSVPRPKRVPRAIRFIRAFIRRHIKTERVWISPELNMLIWSRGRQKPPRKVKVRVVVEDEVAKVYPA